MPQHFRGLLLGSRTSVSVQVVRSVSRHVVVQANRARLSLLKHTQDHGIRDQLVSLGLEPHE